MPDLLGGTFGLLGAGGSGGQACGPRVQLVRYRWSVTSLLHDMQEMLRSWPLGQTPVRSWGPAVLRAPSALHAACRWQAGDLGGAPAMPQ